MSEWMAGVGNHLWQTTAFAVVVWVMTLLLRKNQARVRYGLWVAASVKFLLPFSLLIALGGMLLRPQRMVAAPAVYSTMDEVALPFSEPMPEADPTHTAMKPRHEWGARVVEAVPAALGVVWGCGVVMVLAVWASRWRRVWKTLRRAEMVEQGREFDLLQQVQRAMGGRARVSLRLSRELMEPGIFGILRPVLIWPQRLSDRLDDEHIQAILIHELAHVRRRDNLTAALHMLVEALFWFHPAVWWMERRLVEERERACDEAVVAMGSKPGVYADSLLKAVRFCVESPLTCVAGITGADLSKRVRGIMTLRLERLGVGRKVALAAFGLAVVGVPILLGQGKPAQRMLLAAVDAAPKPFQAAAHAMMPLEETPVAGEIAEVQVPGGVDATLAQAEAKPFAFDVVSIRPAAPPPVNNGRPRMIGYQFTDDGFTATNQSLIMTLLFQYQPEFQLDSTRVVGGPDWARTLRWDIHAKVADSDIVEWSKLSHDSSATARERLRATVGAMLAERFKLKTHIETKEGTVYALVVAKGGSKLKPSISDAPPRMDIGRGGPGHLSVERAEIGAMLPFFAQEIGHPVIDKTGITGKYDMSLAWTGTSGQAGVAGGDARAGDSAAPSLFTAVQEQLGLKLEARKGPIETLVIDSAEKPSVDGAEVQDKADSGTPTLPVDSKPLAFDVVSIKPAKRGSSGQDSDFADGRFVATNISLKNLMQYDTYGMPAERILGWPSWVDSARFDIAARLDAASYDRLKRLNPEQAQLATRALFEQFLAEQFKLAVHKDTQTLPVYALELAKGGPKFHVMAAGGDEDSTSSHNRQLVAKGVTMRRLADTFTRLFGQQLGRVVIDKTGLEGMYDLTLDWAPPPDAAVGAQNDLGAAIFTAVEEQLGLKMVSAKGPVEVLVIDHAEMPAAN